MGFLKRKRVDTSDVDVQSCLANLDRIEAIAASGIDRPPLGPRYDALMQSAAERLHTPMAFVSIVGSQAVHLAGAYGVAGELAETRTNSAESTYCQYVVAFDDVLVVDDASRDSLVAEHPATADGIRAYLGVPLRHGGHTLGSVCVVDTTPRQWTEEDLTVLEDLADDVLKVAG